MENQFKKISVVGLGYIGLPTAAMFASRKIEVVGLDVSQSTVDTINRGEIHIVEPDLDMVVKAAVHEGYLRATKEPEPADAFLIAVPTPFKGENHEPDLSYIRAASKAIAPVLGKGNLVILESTSPVGATEEMVNWLAEERPDLSFPSTAGEASDIRIAHCPERVLPGKVMQELITNDRVIGGVTPRCSQAAAALYKTFVASDCVIASGPRVAEMAKLTENSFRDVNIAFANELSLISEELNIDVWELIALANRHPRVEILKPGPGVGGHCIAVDPWFIVNSAPKHSNLIRTARTVNKSKPQWVLEQVQALTEQFRAENTNKTPEDVTLAVYGLAFKPDIDDLRESPALDIAVALTNRHLGQVLVVEPNISVAPKELSNATLTSVDTALSQAHIHIVLVAHRSFQGIVFPRNYVIDVVGLAAPRRTHA